MKDHFSVVQKSWTRSAQIGRAQLAQAGMEREDCEEVNEKLLNLLCKFD